MIGDLFEPAKPQAPELRQAVKIICKLQEAGIPLILSQVNHDVSYSRARRYGGDILEFLADLEEVGFEIGQGSYSDVCELKTDRCCFNIGVGYHDEHTKGCRLDVPQLMRQLAKLKAFCSKYGNKEYIRENEGHHMIDGWMYDDGPMWGDDYPEGFCVDCGEPAETVNDYDLCKTCNSLYK